MDPVQAATIGIGLATIIWGMAKETGMVGSPDWTKYVDAGLYVSGQTIALLNEMKTDPSKYDDMTPDQVRTLLMPKTFDELEQIAMIERIAEAAGGAQG